MASVSKNVYIEKLDNTASNDNNSWNSAIKCKILLCIIQTIIRRGLNLVLVIRMYQNIFAKENVPDWTEEVFVVKKVKSTVSWTYVIEDLKREEVKRMF